MYVPLGFTYSSQLQEVHSFSPSPSSSPSLQGMFVCVCTCMYVGIPRPNDQHQVSFSISTLFRDGSLTEPLGNYLLAIKSCSSCLCLPGAGICRCMLTCSVLSVAAGDLNSGPQACEINISPTEPSLQQPESVYSV